MSENKNYKKLYKEARLEILQLKQKNVILEQQFKKELSNLKQKNVNLEQKFEKERNIRQEDKQKFEKKITSLKQIIKKMKESVKDASGKLAAHDNFNTPPSKKIPRPKPNHTKSKRKQGGQKGHPGKTSKPKPTQFVDVAPKKCPKCDSTDLKVTHEYKRDITEVKRIVETTTTRYNVQNCQCQKCGHDNITPDTQGIPKSGQYGSNITSEVFSAFGYRMPLRVIMKYLIRACGIRLALGTIYNILNRLGEWLDKPALHILAALRMAKILHADETSIHIGGLKFWIWVIHDPQTGASYYVVRKSRGADVVKELLPGWKGTIVCDGWKPYNCIQSLQRCWAHIIREAREYAEKNPNSKPAREILNWLLKIYDDAKKKIPHKKRQDAHDKLSSRIQRLVKKYKRTVLMKSFVKKVNNALPNLFLFVLDPSIPSTNNAAERALREPIVHRKIRGGLRSVDTKWFSNFFTCLMTWNNQGLDCAKEVLKYI